MAKDRCCKRMELEFNDDDGRDRLIDQHSNGQYGIIIHDGGSSHIAIKYCPWCGKFLDQDRIENFADHFIVYYSRKFPDSDLVVRQALIDHMKDTNTEIPDYEPPAYDEIDLDIIKHSKMYPNTTLASRNTFIYLTQRENDRDQY